MAKLDIGIDIPICYACLSFVSLSLDRDDPGEARHWARRLAPDLWCEGLEEPALASVRRACARGEPHAAEALADLEERGGRSPVAWAIVLKLAAELSRRVHTEIAVAQVARERLPLAPPELN